MKNRLIAATLAVAAFLGAPAAASAGNGYSDFYLRGSCHVGRVGGVDFWFTNYDSGRNQTYHTAWDRSGVVWVVDGVYIDGVYRGKSRDMFLSVAGHGAHTVKIVAHIYGSPSDQPKASCAVRR